MSIYKYNTINASKKDNTPVNIDDGPSGFQPIEEGHEFDDDDDKGKDKNK